MVEWIMLSACRIAMIAVPWVLANSGCRCIADYFESILNIFVYILTLLIWFVDKVSMVDIYLIHSIRSSHYPSVFYLLEINGWYQLLTMAITTVERRIHPFHDSSLLVQIGSKSLNSAFFMSNVSVFSGLATYSKALLSLLDHTFLLYST
jgi:hypothetical protein